MRFIKKRNQFEASNVTFNPDTSEAWSYGWWLFAEKMMTPYGKMVVVNDHSYSSSTVRQIVKVKDLLDQLGISYVSFDLGKAGLQAYGWKNEAVKYHQVCVQILEKKQTKGRPGSRAYSYRHAQILKHKETLAFIQALGEE